MAKTGRNRPVNPAPPTLANDISYQVEMKPDLQATTFSPQNAFYFARLANIAYKPKNEAMGLVKGNSTSAGLGFDRFHWFEVLILTFATCSSDYYLG